jgi:hypothetical protein
MRKAKIIQRAPVIAGPKPASVLGKRTARDPDEDSERGEISDDDEDMATPRPTAASANMGPMGAGKYGGGSYGFREREKKRLGIETGVDVSGSNFEAEHAIGYKALAGDSKRFKRKKSPEANKLENEALSYYEQKGMHRKHIGTGSSSTTDESGFTSKSYREATRSLIQAGQIGDALQINQLAYAQLPDFRQSSQSSEGAAATNSYNYMVSNGGNVDYVDEADDQLKTSSFSRSQREEAYVARVVATTGKIPEKAELGKILTQFRAQSWAKHLPPAQQAEFMTNLFWQDD